MTADAMSMKESEGYHRDTTQKDLFGGSVLVDDNQQIHVTTYNPAVAAPNCPTDYRWTNTGDQKVQIAQKSR